MYLYLIPDQIDRYLRCDIEARTRGDHGHPTGWFRPAGYSRHVAANIMNGANQYVAFSNYDQSWSLGTRSGAATISNLDGAAYAGPIASVTCSFGS